MPKVKIARALCIYHTIFYEKIKAFRKVFCLFINEKIDRWNMKLWYVSADEGGREELAYL